MMKTLQRILVIDDDEYVLKSLMRLLRSNKYEVQGCTSPEEALSLCSTRQFDLILSDQRMPSFTGIELFRKVHASQSLVRRLLISGYSDFDKVVAAFNEGVIHKFAIKPWDNEILLELVQDQLRVAKSGKPISVGEKESASSVLEGKRKAANNTLEEFHGIFTNDEALLKQVDLFQSNKNSNSPILISGEIGSGKRLMAEAAHNASNRAQYPFRIFNNSSSSVEQLESTLFGIGENDFSNDGDESAGLFSLAKHGTIVLHEITLIPLEIQRKLAETLERQTYIPVGSDRCLPFDVRIIATTTEDLDLATKGNRLLERLRLQLDVLSFRLPPLRERENDILPLFDMFLRYELNIEPDSTLTMEPLVRDLVSEYGWSGNIVELMNVCTYVASLASACENYIGISSLPPAITEAALEMMPASSPPNALDKLDDAQVQRMIEEFSGRIDPAAKFLGVNRLMLWKRQQELSLKPSSVS